jgi:hypothetical protein
MNNYKNKCDFCRYKTPSGCMVTPNSAYCREATDEYYRYIQSKKTSPPAVKSLRSWDKK